MAKPAQKILFFYCYQCCEAPPTSSAYESLRRSDPHGGGGNSDSPPSSERGSLAIILGPPLGIGKTVEADHEYALLSVPFKNTKALETIVM
jgi:hypothetical protein